MQVSQVNDHITHASLGGGKAKAFQIAQSAEFFQVLSASLYSDGPRAMVREILCNAWDAHIAAGCTDIPVQVTIDDLGVTFRDFGFGIHPDRIEGTYCTYGASTKTEDGRVTGGFGLGSKAPFAVTEHFEVTSFHQGTKTIYNILKVCAEADGLPAAIPIISLPTDETGMQVVVPFSDKCSAHTVKQLVMELAYFGEMAVVLNGIRVNTFKFSECHSGFAILAGDTNNFARSHNGLNLRYGNVIYPIPDHDEYSDDLKWVRVYLNEALKDSHCGYCLVLQAEPDSISVTPSRESLSMSETTVKTVKGLFQQFRRNLQKKAEGLAQRMLQDGINACWVKHDLRPLYQGNMRYIGKPYKISAVKVIKDFQLLAEFFVANSYSQSQVISNLDFKLRINSLIQSGADTTGIIRKINKRACSRYVTFDSLYRPIIKGLYKDSHLDPKRFRIFRYDYRGGKLTNIYNMGGVYKSNILPFMRNYVILTHNITDIVERAPKSLAIQRFYGDLDNSLVYLVPRKPEQIQAAREFFTKRGFVLVDLTRRYTWDAPLKPKAPTKKRANVNGISLAALAIPDGNIILGRLSDIDKLEAAPLAVDPEFYVWIKNPYKKSLADLHRSEREALFRLFKDKGVLVGTDQREAKYKAAGIPSLSEWLQAKVLKELKSNKALRKHYANDLDTVKNSINATANYNLRNAFDVITSDESLTATFKINLNQDDDVSAMVKLVNYVQRSKYQYNSSSEIAKLITGIKTNPALLRFRQKLEASTLADLIDWHKLAIRLEHPEHADDTRKLILKIMKG